MAWRDEHEQPVVAESLQQKGRGLGVVVRLGVQQDQEIALGGSKTSRSMGSTETQRHDRPWDRPDSPTAPEPLSEGPFALGEVVQAEDRNLVVVRDLSQGIED